MNKKDLLLERYDTLMFADGFDDAIVGVSNRAGLEPLVTYDIEKCIDILMKRDGMSYDDAYEYFEFNVLGAYMGENTPIYLDTEGFE
jgi:hypothetical protein